jgi:hypothetical protein
VQLLYQHQQDRSQQQQHQQPQQQQQSQQQPQQQGVPACRLVA